MAFVNFYSVIHFFIWSTTGRYIFNQWKLFFVLSIGWEILELYLPFEFAVEELGNKIMDVVFNTAGFYLGTRIRYDGLVTQISNTTSQNQPGP
jgi:glycopeptide antibiotics resistance protein